MVFDHRCTCRTPGCAHLAAAAFAALDRFPELRKPEQQTFLDTLAARPAEKERQRIVFELAPGDQPHACFVTTVLIGERSGIATPTTPRQVAADEAPAPRLRDVARLMGEGNESRTGVAPTQVVDVLDALIESGNARWHAGGKRLVKGETRVFASASAATLPPRSGVIVGDSGPWYIDADHGCGWTDPHSTARSAASPGGRYPVCSTAADVQASHRAARVRRTGDCRSAKHTGCAVDAVSVPGRVRPDADARRVAAGVRLRRHHHPVRRRPAVRPDRRSGRPVFAAATARPRPPPGSDPPGGPCANADGHAKAAKGRLVYVFRGRDAAEVWQGFIAEPLAGAAGDGLANHGRYRFGPRLVE